jgi:hypothetical protein
MKGSVTIEAAIVVPTVLICILCLIFLVFYFHDQTVLKGLAHQYIQTYGMLEDSTGARYIYDNPVTIRGDTETYKGTFLLADQSALIIEITEYDQMLYREVHVSISVPLGFIFYDGVITAEEKKIITSGTETIRLVELINDFF